MNYFEYATGTFPEGSFRISPSQISRFFDTTSQWYREFLMNEAPAFGGSTASELGNCVHAAAAMYHDTGTVDKQAIVDYISSISNPDVDKSVILEQYKPMIETLVNTYLSKARHTHSEEFISTEVLPNIYVGGSVDAYDQQSGTIVDYKTTSSKTVPTSFPRPYYFQLMTYAWILKAQNRPVNTLKLVYVTRFVDGGYSDKTGKKLKDYPSKCESITHFITDEDWNLIDGCIKLIANSVQHWQNHPEHHYLLAQDWRLYKKPPPTLFKD